MYDVIYILNTVVVSMAIILSNIGARYIIADVDQKQNKLFAHHNMLYLYIFCMAYVGTRDPLMASVVSAMYYIVFG